MSKGKGKGKGKDAGHKPAHPGASRVNSLRRELEDLASDLEHARARRDKAQARLEALEAIAEQLGSAIAAAETEDAARDARRDAADAAARAVSSPAVTASGRTSAKAAHVTRTVEPTTTDDLAVDPGALEAPAAKGRKTRKGSSGDGEMESVVDQLD